MKNLVLFVLVALALLSSTASTCIGADTGTAFTDQVLKVLAECEKITLGTTRADLLKVFTPEGGAIRAERRTFIYRGCPYIKVDVEFKLTDSKEALEEQPIDAISKMTGEQPKDTISKISKPYLGYYIMD